MPVAIHSKIVYNHVKSILQFLPGRALLCIPRRGLAIERGILMLTKEEFQQKIQDGVRILDGATGSNLRAAGMPKGCCTEQWVLENPEPLVALQRAYAAAGSQIIYAPTFQAQPIALKTVGMDAQTEKINEALVALSRSAATWTML